MRKAEGARHGAAPPAAEQVAAGNEALARGAWDEARQLFEAAVAAEEAPEALEGLGLAAWWLDDAPAMFDARERAYRLYVQRGDRRGAARIATWLAWDYQAFRGELAVSNGWIARARRQLEGLEQTPELAALMLREAELAVRNKGVEARQLARDAADVARAIGSVDLEVTALAVEGLTLVDEGDVEGGMWLLDEATAAAVSGELSDLTAIGSTCCRLISACERVGDYERAIQWCERMVEFTRRWQMGTLFAICRTQYASVLVGCGQWQEAERTLLEATADLAARRPPMAIGGVVRLGELRRRQGRADEAAALFAQAPQHPLSLLGRAELALDAGDRDAAGELVRSYLRCVPEESRLDRAAGLELLVRIDPQSERAAAALSSLQELARQVGTPPLRAAAVFAEALVAGDAERMEEAIDLFARSGEPFEGARARRELARITGDPRHDAAAREAFARLAAPRSTNGALSKRELEVLRLVAEGLSDREIAARLVLSDHTVHRHVANIRTKLRQPSRAAAAAYAARAGLL